MSKMFKGCEALSNLKFSNLTTNLVRYMNEMFMNCKNLVSLDLSKFTTGNTTNLTRMFYGMASLEKLDLRQFVPGYNGDMTEVIDMFTNINVENNFSIIIDVDKWRTVKDFKIPENANVTKPEELFE